MLNSIYLPHTDRTATIKNVKGFLTDYYRWNLQRHRFSGRIRYNDIMDFVDDGDLDSEYAQAEFECQLRLKTLKIMQSIDNDSSFLSDLLKYRFINRYHIKYTCELLAEKYSRDYISERTFNRYQTRALLAFSLVCPRDLIVSSNSPYTCP